MGRPVRAVQRQVRRRLARRPGGITLRRSTPLAALVLFATALAGCGNAVGDVESAGVTGIALGRDGHLVVTAYVCRGEVDTVDVTADREGLDDDEENEQLARYKLAKPTSGLVRLDLAEPGDGWSPSTAFEPRADQGILITLEGPDDAETSTAWLTPGNRTTMKPGTIYVLRGDDVDSDDLRAVSRSELTELAQKACE